MKARYLEKFIKKQLLIILFNVLNRKHIFIKQYKPKLLLR